jgi:hypothetical protein
MTGPTLVCSVLPYRPLNEGPTSRLPSSEWQLMQARLAYSSLPYSAGVAQGTGGVPHRGVTSSTHLVNSAGGNTLTFASMFEWSLPQYSVQ